MGATTQTYTYPTTSHKVGNISNGGGARSYDTNGNTTVFGGYTWTYDDRNRMRTLSVSGVLTRTYHYNGKGERVRRVVDQSQASNLLFFYDEAGHLLGEYSEAGVRVAEYVWMGENLVAVLKSHDGTTYQYVETDHLGTPRAVINPATNVTIWRWDITYTAFTTNTAFGEHAPDGNPDGNGAVYGLNLRYPGQYFDGAGPFHYNYFRDYDASTGRYLQPDPIGLEGGISTYAYVNGNPIGFVDPLGLSRKNPGCVAICTTVGAVGGGLIGGTIGAGVGGVGGSAVPIVGTAAGFVSGGMLGTIAGATLGGTTGLALGNWLCSDDDENDCEKLLQDDYQKCRLYTMPGTGARSRCWGSAEERGFACRNKRPLPPLIIW